MVAAQTSFGCSLPIVGLVCRPASDLGRDIVSTFFSTLSSWIASAAVWLLGLVGSLLVGTTAPPVTAAWFLAHQRLLLAVAAPVALLALVGGILHAVLHGAMGELWRTVLLRLPVAVLLGAAGAGLVQLALGATDELCADLARGSGAGLTGSIKALAVAVAATGAAPGLIAILVAGLVVMGALVLWIELVVRAAAITVLTASLPLVLAASLWPPAVAWARRLGEALGALIASKAVVVLVLTIALDAVSHASQGASSALTGAALLLLAAFMPWAVLRLVPLADTAAIAHLEAVRHRATGATRQAAGRVVSMASGLSPVPMPSADPVGSNPIGMLQGEDVDVVAGSALDESVRTWKGPPPIVAVPASAGTHVWEHDQYGPRLVWKPPGHRDDVGR